MHPPQKKCSKSPMLYQILLPKQITVKWGLLELVPSANQHLLSRANRFHKRNGCMISGKKKMQGSASKGKVNNGY